MDREEAYCAGRRRSARWAARLSSLVPLASRSWPHISGRARRPRPQPRRPSRGASGPAGGRAEGFVDAFLQGMRDLGYIEGRDFDIVYRYTDDYAERAPALAEELVRLRPNIILAPATGQAVAAKNATATIPIVTPALADAVHLGLVASEARPGGMSLG